MNVTIDNGKKEGTLSFDVSKETAQKVVDIAWEELTGNSLYTSHQLEGCINSMFHGIDCLESNDKYGFFKSAVDRRPGHAIWVKKEDAERLFKLFELK